MFLGKESYISPNTGALHGNLKKYKLFADRYTVRTASIFWYLIVSPLIEKLTSKNTKKLGDTMKEKNSQQAKVCSAWLSANSTSFLFKKPVENEVNSMLTKML